MCLWLLGIVLVRSLAGQCVRFRVCHDTSDSYRCRARLRHYIGALLLGKHQAAVRVMKQKNKIEHIAKVRTYQCSGNGFGMT